MKIVFMGTPEFSVGALQAMIDAGHDIAAVVTQPDRPKGRGKEMQFTPVKQCAVAANIPVFQPRKIKTEESIEILRSYEADIFVVAAFGQILSKEILEMPRLGCINIHASLLPKYRGAAPIQWAIIDGEQETGVTIMQMDVGIDTGDMLMKKVVPIAKDETEKSLEDKLMQAGADLIVEALPKIEAGDVTPVKQTDEDSCYAKMLHKSLGLIDWHASAISIERLVRGLNPWPSAFTYFKGKTLKIWEAQVIIENTKEPTGVITNITKDSFTVSTGNGQLRVMDVQLEGKKRMQVHDFLLGNQIEIGCRLGREE